MKAYYFVLKMNTANYRIDTMALDNKNDTYNTTKMCYNLFIHFYLQLREKIWVSDYFE